MFYNILNYSILRMLIIFYYASFTICLLWYQNEFRVMCLSLGLCPLPDSNDDMGKSSSVEDLQDPIPDLFNVLTEEEDRQQRWTTFTYAVDLDKLVRQPGTKLSPMDLQIISVGKSWFKAGYSVYQMG